MKCPYCTGSGEAYDPMTGEGPICPACFGTRTEPDSRHEEDEEHEEENDHGEREEDIRGTAIHL